MSGYINIRPSTWPLLPKPYDAQALQKVVGDVEAYLAKHAAFDAYSDGNQPT